MGRAPTPPEAVPDFLVERFGDHSPEELRTIAEYAETSNRYRVDGDVPDHVVAPFAMQDDDTVAACASYAIELAEFLESGGVDEPDEPSGTHARDDAPIRGGSFFG
ncbi:hypothetical protein [Halovivax sp.]|uniref:hypothetical protein n=1 Tax=Halovivax sp. TaxID=1935978 RepID=UPI0025BFDD4B|nr:hypothetical protein [Halovivax sp.]